MPLEKVIIVTGASRGLGAATAGILVEQQVRVVLNARSEKELQHRAGEIDPSGTRVLVAAGDISRPDVCERVIQAAVTRWGRLDGLVNNASILQPIATIAEADPAAWQDNLRVNLLAPFYLTHYALPYLRQQQGRVINVSSGAAVRAVEGWGAYCTAKAGLNHFTRVLAAEEPEVVALALRPGVVDTEMQAEIREEGAAGMPEQNHQRFVKLHREGDLLPPEQPGRALAALVLRAPAEWSGEFLEWDEKKVQELL